MIKRKKKPQGFTLQDYINLIMCREYHACLSNQVVVAKSILSMQIAIRKL